MPRRPRTCPPGLPVHVVQRGNNRQVCFAADADLKAYANWLYEAATKHDVHVHAWVFMTNHVHLLLTPQTVGAVSRCLQFLGRHYVRYFNYRYGRSGTLFEGRFKSNVVQTSGYLLACQRYIELNPVRAGMVNDPADYSWSSYRAHAFGQPVKLWHPHPEYLALGSTATARRAVYRSFSAQGVDVEALSDIRHALNKGLALGGDRFKREVTHLTGLRQHLLKRGPKPKSQIGEFLL